MSNPTIPDDPRFRTRDGVDEFRDHNDSEHYGAADLWYPINGLLGLRKQNCVNAARAAWLDNRYRFLREGAAWRDYTRKAAAWAAWGREER